MQSCTHSAHHKSQGKGLKPGVKVPSAASATVAGVGTPFRSRCCGSRCGRSVAMRACHHRHCYVSATHVRTPDLEGGVALAMTRRLVEDAAEKASHDVALEAIAQWLTAIQLHKAARILQLTR